VIEVQHTFEGNDLLETEYASSDTSLPEADSSTIKMSGVKAGGTGRNTHVIEENCALSEMSAIEAHRSPAEPTALERYLLLKCGIIKKNFATGEIRSGEIAAIEDHTCEVKVISFPSDGRIIAKMRGNDAYHSMPNLLIVPPRNAFPALLFRGSNGIRHAKIAAQHVDARLPMRSPIVSESSHGIYPGRSDSSVKIAKLACNCREALCKQSSFLASFSTLVKFMSTFNDTLTPVRNNQGYNPPAACNDGKNEFNKVEPIVWCQRPGWR
jgi:hypothetical protein